jgi:primosomal protein N' (replication factor Y)
MSYPPVWNMMVVHITGSDEKEVAQAASVIAKYLGTNISRNANARHNISRVLLVGPADATISRINDIYRKVVYMKADDYRALVALKDRLEAFTDKNTAFRGVAVQYDFNPASGF